MSNGRFVLGLAGPPAAGKSSVATAVAQITGARQVSFGDFVRSHAQHRALGHARETLQRLGQQLLDELGPSGFVAATLGAAGLTPADQPVVWDGVRHLRVFDALTDLYAVAVQLVYLEPPQDQRRSRLLTDGVDDETLRRWDADDTERERSALAARADLVCHAGDLDDAVAETIQLLRGTPATSSPARQRRPS